MCKSTPSLSIMGGGGGYIYSYWVRALSNAIRVLSYMQPSDYSMYCIPGVYYTTVISAITLQSYLLLNRASSSPNRLDEHLVELTRALSSAGMGELSVSNVSLASV